MSAYLKRPRTRLSDPNGLTHNERRVVDLMLEGRRPMEIAKLLETSHGSVKTLAQLAYRKIGVRSQVELMASPLVQSKVEKYQ